MITNFERYSKNTNAFSKEEVESINTKSVCIIGCGGLGGYVAMTLARFGVGKLTLVDGDVFVHSNLNRQLFSTEANLGENKAFEAKKVLTVVNSDIEVVAIPEMLTEANYGRILTGHDAAMDCLDNAPARLLLEKACNEVNIPFVHGAIGGFYGQVCCVFPGDTVMQFFYGGKESVSSNNPAGNPPFTPQLIASIQCSEVLKLLAGHENILRHMLLVADLRQNSFQTVEMKT